MLISSARRLQCRVVWRTTPLPGDLTQCTLCLLQVRSVPVNGWGRASDERERKAIVTPSLFIYILAMQSQQFSLSQGRNKQSKCFLAHICELLKQAPYCSPTMSVAFYIFSCSVSWMFYDKGTCRGMSGPDIPRASH